MFVFKYASLAVASASVFLLYGIQQVSADDEFIVSWDVVTDKVEITGMDGNSIDPPTTGRRQLNPVPLPDLGMASGTFTFPDNAICNNITGILVNLYVDTTPIGDLTIDMTATTGVTRLGPSTTSTVTLATAIGGGVATDQNKVFVFGDDPYPYPPNEGLPPANNFPVGYPATFYFTSQGNVLQGFDGLAATQGGTWGLTVKDSISSGGPGTFVKGEIFVHCTGNVIGFGAVIDGDPHIQTWGGEHFDFQGECDLVMVDNPDFDDGKGMHFHGRTKLHGGWSSLSAAAVKIGDDVLEVHGNDHPLINGVQFPLDVKTGDEFAFPVSVGDYPLTVQQLGPNSRRHIIHMGDGEKIYIINFKDFVDIKVDSPRAHEFAGSNGLLGSFSTGHMLARDGKTVIEDANMFGQEWQVRDTDPQLFHLLDGPQYPAKCNMPVVLTAEQRQLRGIASISQEEAEKACAKAKPADMKNCIDDVLLSSNVDMAGGYSI